MPRFDPNTYDPNGRGEFTPPPEGDYSFVVVGAEERTSKAGNEMLSLTMSFDVDREKELTVYDQLVFTDKAMWMVHDFCACVGHDFSTGELMPEDAQGRSGVARLKLGEPNSKGNRYMEVERFNAREGYSEQPASGSMGKTNPRRPQAPPVTVPPDDDGPPPLTDDDAPRYVVGGDNIPF